MEITDTELETAFHFYLDHYTKCGDKHYDDTPDWKIIDLYWDNIIDKVLQDLPMMCDEEIEDIIIRLTNLS